MRLHLGVNDIPYIEAPHRKGRRRKRRGLTKTTGDVADILEARYGIIQTYLENHSKEILATLEKAIKGNLENQLLGAPKTQTGLINTSEIEHGFHRFLETREMDGLPGVPTQAALKGVSHRFRRKRGSPRPSFIDTGLYENSFHAWID